MVSEVVVVEGIVKKYGGVVAVDNVSFRVYRGEVFSLLGPNGAGKTTTVEILECLRTPTSGDAFVKGLSVKNPGDSMKIKQIIGVLPQDFKAIDNLTVFENVQLAAVAKKADNIQEVLDSLGLWEIRKQMFSKLSGGLKRRVGIAMALVGNPEIVFLDEPTTGFDPEARRETWLYIKNIQKSGATVILTTHYMEEAERLSDRVAVMVRGRIAVEGRVRELVAKYGGRTRLVFDFLEPEAAQLLREGGYLVEQTEEGLVVIKVEKESEVFDVVALLRSGGFMAYPQVRQPGLEDVFLSVIGSRLSETGELI
ncbi:putative ABC transporter ATP-binding protein YbhF [Candidatus Calditenuaceae archaeon HR02]|nr:putative ABC transporter ATP-binding protein YbhF [Candidatus Calditenuaceae archaeon HR02]